jgi:CheY-like chemotaxis protein
MFPSWNRFRQLHRILAILGAENAAMSPKGTKRLSCVKIIRMKTILFADDQKNIREYCRAAFTEEGYRVVLARDGIEALERFVTETPDLAILDISMPRSSGLATLEQIKRLSPRTPVILFTAHGEDCMRDNRALLATACVAKAADLAELKQIVDQTFKTPVSESGESL